MPIDTPPTAPLLVYSIARPEWLALHHEDVIDPEQPIIDAHFHLWDRPGERFLLDEALYEAQSGHNVLASVFVECQARYRSEGPDALRPVGEVEFVAESAETCLTRAPGGPRIAAGIVGHADLTLGAGVQSVLEAEIMAGRGRFRGIRHSTVHDPDPAVAAVYHLKPAGMMRDSRFREGFACLGPLGLSFDAWLLSPQIDELNELARTFPETKIVLDHCGGPLGIGAYAQQGAKTFQTWKAAIFDLAQSPNVYVKLGGLALRTAGFNFESRQVPPSSVELANAWRPYIETCIDAFGPERAMFESNFPPDRGQCSFRTLFNAFKHIAKPYTRDERNAMFYDTAARFYNLDLE